jgi:hypothetical protein
MSAALKNKYIVRTRHSKLGADDRFVPVNACQGKEDLKGKIIHIEDEGPSRVVQIAAEASKL